MHRDSGGGGCQGQQQGGGRGGSEVLAKPFQLVEKEVHISLGQRWVGHNHAEKVAPGPMGLVAYHHGALLHHALLEYWGHLSQPFTVVRALLLPPQAGGHEPETHIDKLRLHDQLKSFSLLQFLHQVPGKGKGLVDAPLQPLPALCLPHEPQLQTVHAAATLHHLISRVQSHVIELVLLEEVAGLGPVAAPKQVLLVGVGGVWGRLSDAPKASSRAARGDFLAQPTRSFPGH